MEKRAKKKNVAWVRRWHMPSPGAKPSGAKVYISAPEVRRIINDQLGPKLAKNLGLYLADGEYFCTPLKDAQEIIHRSKVDRHTWVTERFDCDDFAHVLKAHFAEAAYADGTRRTAHCFGIVWGSLPGPHAINWMINEDKVLRFVEPQNDRIFAPRRIDKDIYFMLV